MNPGRRQRLALLQERRRALRLRSQLQRGELAAACTAVAHRLHWLDLGWAAASTLRRRPWLLALPAFAWAWLGPGRLGRLVAVLPLLLRLGSSGR